MNLTSDNARSCDESILVGKENETIIECEKTGILNLAYKQGLSFKNFKESHMFKEILEEIGVSKSTEFFKVKLVKMLEKSLLPLNFIINYMKSIKQI